MSVDPKPMREDTDRWEHPALTAARKARTLRKGKPTEADRPRPSTFSGETRRTIPGQLSLDEEPPRKVAALYVDPKGVYAGLPDVEVWDEARDARLYAGPWPVVAHPPCARWSRWAGFTEAVFGLKRHEDNGCFASALASVRRFGGVIEHPAYSEAWDVFNLPEPQWKGGWVGGLCGGFSAYVEQGRYGHPAKKATWLYAFGIELPELRWGFTPDGEHAWKVSWHGRSKGGRELTKRERSATPLAFRDELLSMANSLDVRPVTA